MSKYNYFITGGTGTLGQETTRQLLLDPNTALITIFSRDEFKQKMMADKFRDRRLHFVIGDIRDIQSLMSAMVLPYRYVFHFAALKHISSCEQNPTECLKTNFHGTMNVLNVALSKDVGKFIFSTTDKAVNPINIYGMSKLMAERELEKFNKFYNYNKIVMFRWGNVLGSRGSFIDVIKENIKRGDDTFIAVTPFEDVTRFWILIEDAVQFMISQSLKENNGYWPRVPSMKGASIKRIYHAVCKSLLMEPLYSEKSLDDTEKIHEEIFIDGDHFDSKNIEQYSDDQLLGMVAFLND